jgi:acyl carrier protein
VSSVEIYDKLNSLFREVFDDDSIIIKPETSANDIDAWDSFVNISLMVAVESRFGIRLTTSEIESLKSVGDLANTIQAKTRNN